jgi:Icc-related predicted phosphoesterase
MELLHVSDTHGKLDPLDTFGDLVVHSGDFCPDLTKGIKRGEADRQFQRGWLKNNRDNILRWTNGRKIFICRGNHDIVDPAEELNHPNIINLSLGNIVDFAGFKFVGFPYVPIVRGNGWGELDSAEMQTKLIELRESANKVDFVVAHCPPAGVLADVYGNNLLNDEIIDHWHPAPKALLCGHIHSDGGRTLDFYNLFVSNAATKSVRLQIENGKVIHVPDLY